MPENNENNLRSTPGNLPEPNYKAPRKDDAWSQDYFSSAYTGLNDLKNLKVETEEGLEKLAQLTKNPDLKDYSRETNLDLHKGITGYSSQGFYDNTIVNANDVAGILDWRDAMNYAIQNYAFSGQGDDFNGVVSAITKLRETAEDVDKRPDKYFAERLKGLAEDDGSRDFWTSVKNQVIHGDVERAHKQAVDGIRTYGTPKFIGDNLRTGDNAKTQYETKVKEHYDRVKAAVKVKADGLERDLTSYELAEVRDSFADERKELDKANKDEAVAYEIMPKMVKSLQDTAYATIDAKRKAKEARRTLRA